MDWSIGYVADINYDGHYYAELNPIRQRLALINAGYKPRKIETACELGFGQGVSVNIHAASQSSTRWFGNDFLPQQAQFAQSIAESAGSKAVLTDESFAEFCSRDDLPDFDYICLHGIWSWISDDDRARIVDFIRRKLRVGGIVYASYNVMPGWALFSPMRELFKIHANHMSPPSIGSIEKVSESLEFVENLINVDAKYFYGQGDLKARFDGIKKLSKSYLAHEYFNSNWRTMYFHEIASMMSEAKLTFASSANYHELIDELWMTPEQRTLVDGAPNNVLSQQLRDFVVNCQFRKDIWIKGGENLEGIQCVSEFRSETIVLVVNSETIDFSVNIAGKSFTLQEEVYRPIISELSDNKPKNIGYLIDKVSNDAIGVAHITQAVMILIGLGWIAIAQPESVVKSALPIVARFNRDVLKRGRFNDDAANLASAVTGGAILVDNVTLRVLYHMQVGKAKLADIAEMVAGELRARGRAVVDETGNKIESPEETLSAIGSIVDRVKPALTSFYQPLGVAFS